MTPQPYVKGSYPTPAPTATRPAGAGHLSAVLVADTGSAAAAHGKAPAAEPNPPVSSDRSTKVSYAIFELDIRQPPATAHRYANGWYIRCDRCAKRGPLSRLLSEALLRHDDHADTHVDDDAVALEAVLSTTRRRCVVHIPPTGEWRESTTAATVQVTRKDVA